MVSRTYTIDHIAYLKLPLAKSNTIYAAFSYLFIIIIVFVTCKHERWTTEARPRKQQKKLHLW